MKRSLSTNRLSPTRRELLSYGATGVLAAGFGLRTTSVLAQSTNLQWGSSSIGSTGYVIMEGLANTVNRNTDLQNASMATKGGAENMQLMWENVIQLAQTTSTDWQPAAQGAAPYPEPIEVHQMLAYTLFNCTPIVRADSEIQTLDDLKGRRCMPSPAGSSTAAMWSVLFEAAGIQDEVEWTYGSWRESYDALRSGSVDCIPSLLTNGRPSPILSELGATVPVRVLPISDEVMARARELNPGIASGIIPGGVVPGVDADINAASFSGVLASQKDLDPEVQYQVIASIYNNEADVRQLGVQFEDIGLQFGVDFLLEKFPVAKGAARYYKEKGVWRDELTIAG